jgi:hypothetical protein
MSCVGQVENVVPSINLQSPHYVDVILTVHGYMSAMQTRKGGYMNGHDVLSSASGFSHAEGSRKLA